MFRKKFNLKLFILLSLCLILQFNQIFCAQLPRFLGSEKKFRSYIYNPNEVYRYIGHYTYQGFIEFEAGETINTISMGDPTIWMFEHLENRLFLKPIGENNSQTNMSVITNKRIYHFELAAKEASGINDKDLVFVVKFSYPEEQDKNIVELAKSEKSDKPDFTDLSIYNFDYQYVGDNAITPIRVFDNNQFTYFQFANKNSEIPAIFSVDGAGYESLVNFRSSGDFIVVEQMSPQFTLRSGVEVVCIYNSRMYNQNKNLGGIKYSNQNSINRLSIETKKPRKKPNYPIIDNGNQSNYHDLNNSLQGESAFNYSSLENSPSINNSNTQNNAYFQQNNQNTNLPSKNNDSFQNNKAIYMPNLNSQTNSLNSEINQNNKILEKSVKNSPNLTKNQPQLNNKIIQNYNQNQQPNPTNQVPSILYQNKKAQLTQDDDFIPNFVTPD